MHQNLKSWKKPHHVQVGFADWTVSEGEHNLNHSHISGSWSSNGHESKRFGMEHVLLNISFHTPFHTCGTTCLFAVPYPSFHTYGFLVYNCSRFNQNVRFAC